MDEGRRRASKPGAFAPHKAFQCGPINRPRLSRPASKSAMSYNAHTAHTCDTTCQTIQRTVYTGVKSSFSTFVWIGASARRNVLEGERSFAVEADSDVGALQWADGMHTRAGPTCFAGDSAWRGFYALGGTPCSHRTLCRDEAQLPSRRSAPKSTRRVAQAAATGLPSTLRKQALATCNPAQQEIWHPSQAHSDCRRPRAD